MVKPKDIDKPWCYGKAQGEQQQHLFSIIRNDYNKALQIQVEVQTTEEPEVVPLPNISYVIPYFTANWHKSVEYCNYLGLRLAVIDSREKEAGLYAAVKASDVYSSGSTLVWVGASDLADEGNFHWHGTGRRVAYSNWARRQPDNAGAEHCVEVGLHEYPSLSMQWQWNDRDCKANRYFVCEGY
ncbi:perlucin-like [Culex pipiens pallens]|uniref:perlucin-like n=1 Tax=Culex pipiens pallens TaxID=42434 RepID=UPI0022AA6E6E|nr:perlucin-like [Culex pipiens pallens]